MHAYAEEEFKSYELRIKNERVVVSCLGMLMLAASTVVVPPAPGGAQDGETSTNVVLSLRPDGNRFRLSFTIEATPSNNVEVAFGVDRNADGDLVTGETGFLIGWRGDRWVAFDMAGEQVAEAVSPGGLTELVWTVRLRGETGMPRTLTAALDGAAAFAEWSTNPPHCLFDPEWTHAKVFVRGEGPTVGHIDFRRFNEGSLLFIR